MIDEVHTVYLLLAREKCECASYVPYVVREDLRKVSQLHFRSIMEVMDSVGVAQPQVDPLQSLQTTTIRQYTAQQPYQ